MKRTAGGLRAHEMEFIQATSGEGFSNRAVYVIEGMAGFFRRLTQKAGAANPLRVTAFFGDTLIDLVPAEAINSEFAEAGYEEQFKVLQLKTNEPKQPDVVANNDTLAEGELVEGELPNDAVENPLPVSGNQVDESEVEVTV